MTDKPLSKKNSLYGGDASSRIELKDDLEKLGHREERSILDAKQLGKFALSQKRTSSIWRLETRTMRRVLTARTRTREEPRRRARMARRARQPSFPTRAG